ncbi:MAG TPA: ABC transporter substrate-binding protein [Myxococcales bacterium]|jgi:ABC-type branched-subunit amino acid transport system substrate-binding protein
MKPAPRSSASSASRLAVAVAVACALAASACSTEQDEAVRIGGLFSTTGPEAAKGFAQLSAARVAVQQINDNGGVLGKRLVLVYRDDGGDANKTRRAVEALLDESVPAIIGAVSSASTEIAASIAAKKAVIVSASATASSFESVDLSTFRLCASAAAEGRLLAARALRTGHRAAVLRSAEKGLDDVASEFETRFRRDGGEVLSSQPLVAGAESYRTVLAEALAGDPDVVLLDLDPLDGAQVVRDYSLGLSNRHARWFFTHRLVDAAFVTAAGPHAFAFPHEGTAPSTPTGMRFKYFADAYQERFGEPPPAGSYAANAYDAVFLVAASMEAAKDATAAGVRAQLRATSLGGAALGPNEWADLAKAAQSGQDINYEGASGSVDINVTGSVDAPFDIWQVESGSITVIERAVRPPL